MISINSNFLDTINLVLFRQKQLDDNVFETQTVEDEYDLSEVSVSFVKDLLNNNPPDNCRFKSYGSNDDDSSSCTLIVIRYLTEDEKAKRIIECKGNMRYHKHKLLKWMEKPEYKDQILNYLSHKNINIEGINK